MKHIRIWHGSWSHEYRSCRISHHDRKENRLVFISGDVKYDVIYGIDAYVEITDE